MDKESVLNVISFLEARLVDDGVRIERTVLFGSWQAGSASSDSDIDVVIVSADFEGKDLFDRAGMVTQAEVLTIRKFLVPLDLVCMTPGEYADGDSIMAQYARSGEQIGATVSHEAAG